MILIQAKSFLKDSKKFKMSDKHFTRFVEYLYLLSQNRPLPPEAKDHALDGEWNNFRECHISGDLLLIYQIEDDTVELVRIGSHSQLFKTM
jgi:mRNA interferase YafQ